MPQLVLLIDDCDILHALVRSELTADGLEVEGAFDGAAGIRMARELSPDLILLDVSMPGMDGHEVCQQLQAEAETAHIPVIFLSAASEPADRVRGLNQGASDYIVKPFIGAELRARVRVSLRQRMLLDTERRRAMRDGLTGLWNRAYFDDRLEAETAAAVRHRHPLSCVLLDIDRFKSINDTYGHAFGDTAIRSVARLLQKHCRREDVACRYGGEEFVVLCPVVNASGALVLAERLRRGTAELALNGPRGPVTITASFGVADTAQGTGPALVEAADRALYAAKHSGRNRVVVATVNPNAPASLPVPHVA